MAHYVKCFYCGNRFDRDKDPCIKINDRRYAHLECIQQQEDDSLLQEQKDKDTFYEMVKSIYGKDYNYLLINGQATSYIEQYGYTWSGMTGCLHWFYNIKHNNIEESNGGIGIIPYIYDEVKKYYQNIYKAQKKNKKIKNLRQIVNFDIQSPRAWQQPPRLLNLDESEEDNE